MGADVVDLKNVFEGNGILKVGSLVVSGDALGEAYLSLPLCAADNNISVADINCKDHFIRVLSSSLR